MKVHSNTQSTVAAGIERHLLDQRPEFARFSLLRGPPSTIIRDTTARIDLFAIIVINSAIIIKIVGVVVVVVVIVISSSTCTATVARGAFIALAVPSTTARMKRLARDECVAQQLHGGPPLGRVALQSARDKVAKGARKLASLGRCR